MASKKKAKARVAGTVRYTADAPLVIDGKCWVQVESPRRFRSLQPILSTAVELVPAYKRTHKGRSSERQMRVVIMGSGLALAVFGGSMGLALLGGVIAMLGNLVPVPEGRKIRWRRQVAALSEPKVSRVSEPVQVQFDGAGVTLLRDGRYERRVRLNDDEGRTHLRAVDGRVALEFRPRTGGKKAQIWVLADAPDDMEPPVKSLQTQDPRKLDRPVTVSSDHWVKLHAATRP